ncbi:MAG: hypothetical protein GX456_15060 [Verrucomicrobia bacterium]|nr:hypothetical protein [Verrucomicrobiota bacterium]
MGDTVPIPNKPLSIEIPIEFLKEFKNTPRVVIRHPWVVGIPVPDLLLQRLANDPRAFAALSKKFDVMLVPK